MQRLAQVEVTPELIQQLPIFEMALANCSDEAKLQFHMLQFQILRSQQRGEILSNHQATVGPWLAEHCRMEEGK